MDRFAPILVLACLLLVAPPARANQVRDLTAPEVREMVEEDGALLVHVLSLRFPRRCRAPCLR